MLGAGIFVFCILFLWLFIDLQKAKTEDKKAYEVRQTIYYDSNVHLLTVIERSSKVKDALIINEGRNVIAQYTPDKIIYTGATVRGITTGGFHTQKGGYSMSLGDKTGNYYLTYKYAKDHITTNPALGESQYEADIVSFVRLTTADFEKAQSHPLLKKLVASEETKERFHINGSNMLNLIHLTKDEASEVVNWLAGEK